jgi:N-acetylneuraminic acid mutarotase
MRRALLLLLALLIGACVDLEDPTACSEDPTRCDGSDAGIDSVADSGATDSRLETGLDSSTVDVMGESDGGAEVSDGGCSDDGKECATGDTRVGGTCAVGEDGKQTCNSSCRWETTCTPRKGWRAMAKPPLAFVARYYATGVWTGSKMVVFGGVPTGGGTLSDGAAYDVAKDTWSSLPAAVGKRFRHTAVWTGTDMIVWGGNTLSGAVASGESFSLATSSWKPISASPLSARFDHVAVWADTTKEMLVWGGSTATPDGAAYNPATDTWRTLPASPLTVRSRAAAVWTGTEMVVWGGIDAGSTTLFQDGARYNPSTNTWTALPAAPSSLNGRARMGVAFTGTDVLLWGGLSSISPFVVSNGGGMFNTSSLGWKPLAVPSASVMSEKYNPQTWFGGGRFWTFSGTQDVGAGSLRPTLQGASYDPVGDSWAAMNLTDAPVARQLAVVVWTGKHALVWGGDGSGGGDALDDGGVFVP